MFKFLRKIIGWLKPGYFLYVAHDSGLPNQPTIVFLHGIAATAKTWESVIKNLDTKKYRLVALDLLGFGQSPKPQRCRFTVNDHMRAVKKTLYSLGIKKATFVGHSMGSIIATHYATKNPKKIERLFLVSPPLYLKKDEANQSYLIKKETSLILKGFEYLLKNKKLSLKASKLFRQFLNVKDGAEIIEQNWHSFEQSLKNTILDQNTYQEISQLNQPITVIYGSLDGLLVKAVIRSLSKQSNVRVIELKGKRHLITDSFAEAIADRLN